MKYHSKYVVKDAGFAEVPEFMKEAVDQERAAAQKAPRSDQCKGSTWRTEEQTHIKGFEIVHNLNGLENHHN
jgi:hypothetical protein